MAISLSTTSYWAKRALVTTEEKPKQGTLLTQRWDKRGYNPTAPASQRRYWGGTFDPKGGTS